MTKVLITGFGAFGKTTINPAKLVAEALDGTKIDEATVVSVIVPCNFFESIDAAAGAIEKVRPEMVVMLGEYGGRSMVTVERLAHNLNDSSRYQLADNVGKVMQGEPTAPDGPAAYYSTAPIRAMVTAMRDEGIPADISDTPGTNVCNHLMYGVLHHIATNQLLIRAAWVHLPHLPGTAAEIDNLGAPSMSKETSTAAVTVAIRAFGRNKTDINEPILSKWQI